VNGGSGTTTLELARSNFAALGGWILADTPGEREELRSLVDRAIRDMVDGLKVDERPALWFGTAGIGLAEVEVGIPTLGFRIRNADGRLAGTGVINKLAVGMATLSAMISRPAPIASGGWRGVQPASGYWLRAGRRPGPGDRPGSRAARRGPTSISLGRRWSRTRAAA
jgi:hypothetical protein